MLRGGANLIVNEVTVEKWVYGGGALSRVEGQVVLTPFLLPGEVARIETEPGGKQMLRGRAEDVLSPSPERTEPPCPYFFRCGGCHYQHAKYPYQIAQKVEIVREQLRRVGRIAYDGPIDTISGPDLGYRNRTQFHARDRQIGYFVEGSHTLVPIDYCPISSPAINRTLTTLLEMAADPRWPSFLRSVEVFTNEDQVLLNVLESDRPVARHFFDWCAERIPGYAPSSIDYPAGGLTYRVGHRSFFQVNRFLIDALVDAAAADVTGDRAIDLYAGVGLFSIRLASRFGNVIAVESGRAAVRDLEANAQRAGLQVNAAQDDVESFLAKTDTTPDFVLADPPRAGLGKRAVRELLRLAPAKIHIVACDPSTLARDLAALTAGGYRIERLTMADLFPHTYHIETVAQLLR